MNRPYYPSLDGLRGIAAYTVMVGHFANYTGLWADYFARGTGQLGVMLFFALSGFLMGSLYARDNISYIKVYNYYLKRIARVFPLYFLIVILSYYFYSADHKSILFEVNNKNIFDHLLFIKGDHILWTVAVEVQFYILFPIIWIISFYIKNYFYIIISLIFFLIFFVNGEPRTLLGHAHYFLLGLLISLIPNNNNALGNIIFTISFIVFFISIPGWPIHYDFISVKSMWFDLIFIVSVGLIIYGSTVSSIANYVFGSKLPSFIGTISYSIYIWHIPILVLYIEYTSIGMASRAGFLIYFITVHIVSFLSYIIVEKPSRTFISRKIGN